MIGYIFNYYYNKKEFLNIYWGFTFDKNGMIRLINALSENFQQLLWHKCKLLVHTTIRHPFREQGLLKAGQGLSQCGGGGRGAEGLGGPRKKGGPSIL